MFLKQARCVFCKLGTKSYHIFPVIIAPLNRKFPPSRYLGGSSVRRQLSLSQHVTWSCVLARRLRLHVRPDLWGYDREDPVFLSKCSFHWGGPDSRPEYLMAIMTLEQAPLRVPQFSLVIVVPPTAPQWRTEGGGLGCSNPPPNSEGPSYTVNYTQAQRVIICCHNTDHVHVNGHDRNIFVILAKHCKSLPDDGSSVVRNMLEHF